jgi:hypothetical protein
LKRLNHRDSEGKAVERLFSNYDNSVTLDAKESDKPDIKHRAQLQVKNRRKGSV